MFINIIRIFIWGFKAVDPVLIQLFKHVILLVFKCVFRKYIIWISLMNRITFAKKKHINNIATIYK